MDKLYPMIATVFLAPIIGFTQQSSVSGSKTDKETRAIEECLRHYFNAGDLSDPTELRAAFYPGAMMFWVDKDERMNFLTQPQWKSLLGDKDPVRANKRNIMIVDHTNDLCVAKTSSEYSDKIFYDYMAMVKAKGEWKIVCQVQHCTEPIEKKPVQNLEDDRQEIESVLQIKFKSMDSNDPDLLSSVYHPRTMSYYTDDNELVGVSIGEWIARFDFNKRTNSVIPKAERKIQAIDCVGKVGYARFTHKFTNQLVTDYTLALKIANRWRIVSLLFTVEPI